MNVLGDPARLTALARCELMDSGAEEVFDRLTRLAARLLGAPITLMTLLDEQRQYVKSAGGERALTATVPVSESFCQHAVAGGAPFVVDDVRDDARVPASDALVAADLIAYCGVPLTDSDGHTLGTLCAMDGCPHEWSAQDVAVLTDLAAAAMTELELRLAYRRLEGRDAEARSLRERQSQLSHVVEAAEEAINVVDLDGRMIGWNPACERLYGWSAEEVLGRPLTEIGFLVPDTDDQDGFSLDARGLAGESVAARRLQRRCKDGSSIYVDISITPLRDDAGAIAGVTAVARDVTDRHRLSLDLEASERRFRHIFDHAPGGVSLVALDRRLLEVNRAFCELVGYERRELIGRTMEGITHPDDHGTDLAGARAMVAGETAHYTAEKRYFHKSGRIVRVRLSASLVRGEHGEPRYFIAHTEDVTAARESEAALAEARGLLDESQAVAHVGSWSFDLETGAISWSEEQFRLHGLEPAAHAPSVDELAELAAPRDRDVLRASLSGLIARPRAFEGRYRVALPGGRSRMLWTSAEVLDADATTGRPARVSGTTRDITVEHEAERARRVAEQRNQMLATMLQQSEDAIVGMNRDGAIVEWNRGAERLYGYTRAAALGGTVARLIPPERTGEDRELLSRALAGESPQLDTVRLRRDGTPVDVSISVSPLSDETGAITGASAIARDITQRIRESAARREIEERLRVTVEHAPIGVALLDLDALPPGRLLNVNAPFAELLGDPDPVAAGVSLLSAVHPDDVDKLRADLALLASDDGARTETEVRCLHADGRIVWLLVTGSAVPAGTDGSRLAVLHALDIGERKRFEGQLQHLADHDTLTGVFNRRRFEAELGRSVSLARRYGLQSALLMVDLDGFKHVNDTMGHSYGDELITRVASCLRGCLRETDAIGRLGGDEFAIVLGSATPEAAVAVAEKVLRTIAEHGVVTSEARHASVTASIGVAPFDARSELDTEALLVEADLAMYAAKDSGRNRVAVARPDVEGRPRVAGERSWLHRLRAALDQDRFELFAQPIRGICADDGERYELLLRLRGEDGELLAPAAFLPNAERFDLVQEIDRWVFRQALALLAERRDEDVGLSVNMSGRTLSDPQLVADLTAMVAACPIPPGRLIVEVTETAAIVNIERAREVARALRGLGCRFALDDFGSGFASFYYLKHVDFDYLKIDGEFVKALATDPTDQLVVRSVVELARGLGARTIAEFVGDPASVARLRELGVDYGQGYHLGRPGPVAEVLAGVTRRDAPSPA